MKRATDYLGRGWPFPIRPGQDHRLAYLGGREKIRQSIRLILSTVPGERLLRPEFGCGIHELVFRPNTATLHTEVAAEVQEALQRWEPRIDVVDVRVETGRPRKDGEDVPIDTGRINRNVLLIRIDYRIQNSNTLFNMVYPFVMEEGSGIGG